MLNDLIGIPECSFISSLNSLIPQTVVLQQMAAQWNTKTLNVKMKMSKKSKTG